LLSRRVDPDRHVCSHLPLLSVIIAFFFLVYLPFVLLVLFESTGDDWVYSNTKLLPPHLTPRHCAWSGSADDKPPFLILVLYGFTQSPGKMPELPLSSIIKFRTALIFKIRTILSFRFTVNELAPWNRVPDKLIVVQLPYSQ
jgi:hypothetical protein